MSKPLDDYLTLVPEEPVMVKQTSKILWEGASRDGKAWQHCDMILTKVYWGLHETLRNSHSPTPMPYEVGRSSRLTTTRSTETTTKLDLSGELKGLGISWGVERKDIWSEERSQESSTKHTFTAPAHSTMYIYRRTYEFDCRYWWKCDINGTSYAVTQNNGEKYDTGVPTTIQSYEYFPTMAPLQGEHKIRVEPCNDIIRYDSIPHKYLRDVPQVSRAFIAMAWRVAQGGSDTEIKAALEEHISGIELFSAIARKQGGLAAIMFG